MTDHDDCCDREACAECGPCPGHCSTCDAWSKDGASCCASEHPTYWYRTPPTVAQWP